MAARGPNRARGALVARGGTDKNGLITRVMYCQMTPLFSGNLTGLFHQATPNDTIF